MGLWAGTRILSRYLYFPFLSDSWIPGIDGSKVMCLPSSPLTFLIYKLASKRTLPRRDRQLIDS